MQELTKEEVIASLGRPLTSLEDTNFDSYIDIAFHTVEELLCSSLDSVNEAREFDIRQGYHTVFTDIFHDTPSVQLNGEPLDASEYTVRQWDKRQGSWYNSIVLREQTRGYITVTADWGFSELPADIVKLIANAFGEISAKNKAQKTAGIASKKVEDFSISYRTDVTQDDLFIQANSATIRKYSLCGVEGTVSHGKVCR